MVAIVLAFIAGVLAVAGGVTVIPPRVLSGAASWARDRRGRFGAGAIRALSAFGQRLSPHIALSPAAGLRRRIAAAGYPSSASGPLTSLTVRDVMSAKVATAGLGMISGTVVGAAAPGRLGAVIIIVCPVAGFLAPDAWLARKARARASRVHRELPGMLDLLRVTVEAGLSLPAALSAVGERSRGVLAGEWRTVGREVSLGVPLTKALAAMATRLPFPEVTTLIGALDRSRRHGAPLADTLAAQAYEARASRRRRIREEAAQAGPKIQLVVALLLVPSVLLLVAAALLVALVSGGGLAIG